MLVIGAIVSISSADVIRGVEIDFVTIANAGNAGDIRTVNPDSATPYGCGAVDYTYQIGKYEITNGQWNAFVSAAGAPTGNPSNAYDESAYWTGMDVPTTNVSWYEAAQFCNYLTSGDKSQGAYQLGTDESIAIDRGSAISTYGIVYVIPTEDEWYKAAYYNGSGYSTYANGTDALPIAGVNSNYNHEVGQPWGIGNGMQEQNGTYNLMGNVWEWNEALIGSFRGLRGGSYDYHGSDFALSSATRGGNNPNLEYFNLGFRIASVPEPCTLALMSLGIFSLLKKRKP